MNKLLLAIFLLFATSTMADSDEESLKRQLLESYGDKASYFPLALYDLNSDSKPEAIVHLTHPQWCGSGGCSTGIFVKQAGSWKMISNIRITRLPIRVLSNKTNGWNDIGVWVQGGGVRKGYEAVLAFNGKSYPINPSVPPARKTIGESQGKTVLQYNVR